MEYGIFNDEGCLERDFSSAADAQATLDKTYAEDEAWVAPMSRDQADTEEGCEDEEEEEEDE